MNDVILVIFSAVLGYLCSKQGDAANRRREFRAYISVLLVDIECHRPFGALEKHMAKMNEVRLRCAAVEEDVLPWRRDCFRDAWQRYSSERARYEASVARGATFFRNDEAAGTNAKMEVIRRLVELRRLAE
jgi:hypothetical protein